MVIPKALRDRLGIRPGDEVEMTLDADTFAVATAVAHGATLLTGDPEILAGDPNWPTADLRL